MTNFNEKLKILLFLQIVLVFTGSILSGNLTDQLPIVVHHGKVIQAEEQITIYADQNWGQIEIRHGYIHGLQDEDTLSDSMTAFLKPTNWRLYKSESYSEASVHGANITYGTSNHYAWSQGGFPMAKPWLDWDGYEAYVLAVIRYYNDNYPNNPPVYYDIWSEPDHSYFWTGTFDQLVELFARTTILIKSYNPDAKIVGPSISWYRPNGIDEENIIDLLVALDSQYGIRLDAISWHENGGFPDYGPGRPEDIYFDYQTLSQAISESFPTEYQPEFHINEFAGGRVHLSPGWSLGYLFWLNYMKIDFASRACWGVLENTPTGYEYYSDCWAGLNGMFMRDGYTPQPVYWLHRAYAEMEGYDFLQYGTTDANFLAIAGSNDVDETIRILTGIYADTSDQGVRIVIDEYPFADEFARVEIKKIPNFEQFYWDPPVAMPWPDGPILISVENVAITDGIIDLLIEDFNEGEVYIINLYPSSCCSGDRGNANSDPGDLANIADITYLVSYLFGIPSGPPPICIEEANANSDPTETANIADITYLVKFLFGIPSGPAPGACP